MLVTRPTDLAVHNSLGGAIATLMALDLQLSNPNTVVNLVTFGQPRVGNSVRHKKCAIGFKYHSFCRKKSNLSLLRRLLMDPALIYLCRPLWSTLRPTSRRPHRVSCIIATRCRMYLSSAFWIMCASPFCKRQTASLLGTKVLPATPILNLSSSAVVGAGASVTFLRSYFTRRSTRAQAALQLAMAQARIQSAATISTSLTLLLLTT